MKGLCFIILVCLSQVAKAANLTVAVASNFTRPMQAIIEDQGDRGIQAVYASTGTLYAQISNGAPFDLFLAADMKRPERLFTAGLAGKPMQYAAGRVVLWSRIPEVCAAANWQIAMMNPHLKRLAIANPKTAPYGTVAYGAIMALPARKNVESQLVFGQNVAQAFQYATTVTEAGFVAQSMIQGKEGKNGCFWPIPEADLVIQGASVIKRSPNQKEAASLLKFIRGDAGRKILGRFGYGV